MDTHRVLTRGQVRCCSDVKLSGNWTKKANYSCAVWGGSDEGWQCAPRKTFAEAEAICQAAGARLCTVTELEDGCTVGTGCGHDQQLIWASRF